ncbi:uncharacterized protein LOC143280367 [Babylonia areolata]|uniref:uncharacterized protein LOC143280367 n=1 Tax=Babylonia areolata TaxID=304850 RepID=UPI003FD02E1C
MFGGIVRRQTDRASAPQKREAKNGTARRAPDKPDKPQPPVLCGWNLPVIPDDNDIIVWTKREKNGDNKRKKINEVYEEENYRHITGHCTAIENKLLFDRQSLNDRYLKNCQFGVRDARANKVAPVTPLSSVQGARATRPPSQQDRERNCFSANALNDDPLAVEEEVDAEEEVEVAEVRGVSRGRSHSAVCHSASMRGLGMTLPEPGAAASEGEGEGEGVRDEGEDAGWDEGYGSKVSSNDQEHDGGEEDVAKTLEEVGGVDAGAEGEACKAGDPVLTAPFQAQPLSQQDVMAKLMYSRRERTVYERLPSRRMRGNSFRYAGREQSRLTEASLSHINPAYLARYHVLADLATAAQAKHGTAPPPQQGVVENGEGERVGSSGSGKSLQPRTMVLRKITIQDSGKELFSQNIHSTPGNAGAAAGTGPSPALDKVYHQRQGVVSPTTMTHSERAASETTRSSPVSQMHRSGGGVSGGSDPVSMRVHDLSPDVPARNSPGPILASLPLPLPLSSSSSYQANKSAMSTLSVPSAARSEDPAGGSSPALSPSRTSPASDRMSAMSSFAVTDLLPAVERNLRHQRTSQRGLGKSKTMDVTSTFNTINNRHQHQHRQQRGRQPQRQHQATTVGQPQSNGEMAGVRPGQDGAGGGGGGGREDSQRPLSLSNGLTAAPSVRTSASLEDVRSFPGFRPYNHITPLQRAKEIANRRMHGHVTHMPDGSETVRVPSPRYASRSEQRGSHRRAKSASRQRTQQAGTCDVPVSTLSKAHSTLTTSLSTSHGALLTREDMATRLKQL